MFIVIITTFTQIIIKKQDFYTNSKLSLTFLIKWRRAGWIHCWYNVRLASWHSAPLLYLSRTCADLCQGNVSWWSQWFLLLDQFVSGVFSSFVYIRQICYYIVCNEESFSNCCSSNFMPVNSTVASFLLIAQICAVLVRNFELAISRQL